MKCSSSVRETLTKQHGLDSGGKIRIASAVTVENMDLSDVCTCWKWILIDAEADGVGKVRAEGAKELPDALSIGSSCDRLSRFQRRVWNERPAWTEGGRVTLSKEWRRASDCGTYGEH